MNNANLTSGKEKTEVIISVDAGGTSTGYAVIGGEREVLMTCDGGSGSPAVNRNAERDIYDKLEEIYSKIQNIYNLKAIIIGMSGFALIDREAFTTKLRTRFNTEVVVESDAYLALFSILQDKYENGLVVVSGTGAVINAINRGKLFITNGWGELLTERGSAYTTVRDYVRQMVHNNEQKGYLSPLEQKFMQYMNYSKIEDFKMLIYRQPKYVAASHAKFFVEEAKKGDEEAIAWLYHNGKLLGADTISALKRVGMDLEFPIGFSGGFINHVHYLIQGILDTLNENGYQAIVVEGDPDPIFGGYYIAKQKGYI